MLSERSLQAASGTPRDMSSGMTPNRPSARTVAALMIGTGLEWFDFFAYLMLADVVANTFFPVGGRDMGLILTFAAFAAGFVARPVGGFLFGLYADRRGRRRALAPIMLLMSLASLLIAVTPGYGVIGVAAPLLIVTARILQGISVGAEFAGSATYLVECAPPGRKMLYGSFQMSGHSLGVIAASLLILGLERIVPPTTFGDWGWRLPFVAGAVIGPIGLYLRHHLADSPEFATAKASGLRAVGILAPLRPHVPAILLAVGVVATGASIGYLWQFYLPAYIVHKVGLPRPDAVLATTASGIVSAFMFPVAGWLGERIGAYRLCILTIGVFALGAWPLFHWLMGTTHFGRLVYAELIAAAFLGLIGGCWPGQLATLFPVTLRATAVALSYNTAVLLFGGLAPMTVTALIAATGSPMAPAFYQIAVAVLSLVLIALSGQAVLTASARRAAADLAGRPAGS